MPGTHQDPTAELVSRLCAGDSGAVALLDSLYRDAMIRFCWGYLGRMEEAEDALQDVWYKVFTAKDIPRSFRPWLYKVARNHCLNMLRDRGRHKDRHAIPAASQLKESLTGHLTKLVREERRSKLDDVVQSLPESQREVLRLRYVEELSRGEIAEVLDLPESVVKSRLFEGLKRLREHTSLLEER